MEMFIFVYIIDLLITSNNETYHLGHIKILLSKLKKHNLFVAERKPEFMKTKITFLAMIVDSFEMRANRDRVEFLKSWS